MQYYVYEHIRKDTNKVFYVGKGKNKRAYDFNLRNIYWKRIFEKCNVVEVKFLIENVDEELALLVEMERIDQLKKLGIKLSNLTNGGEGSSGLKHTESSKKIISEKAKERKNPMSGRRHTESSKNIMSEKAVGRKSSFRDKKHTDESKKIISDSKKGKIGTKHTEEWKEKMISFHTGRKRTEQTCKNISDSKLGKPQNFMWITNGIDNKKIRKDDNVPFGWNKGRNVSYLNQN